jgi:hypothetical protein
MVASLAMAISSGFCVVLRLISRLVDVCWLLLMFSLGNIHSLQVDRLYYSHSFIHFPTFLVPMHVSTMSSCYVFPSSLLVYHVLSKYFPGVLSKTHNTMTVSQDSNQDCQWNDIL